MTITGAQEPRGIPYVAKLLNLVDLFETAENVHVLIQVKDGEGLGKLLNSRVQGFVESIPGKKS